MSLSELARAAGIGKATLSGLEHGTRNPTLETLYAVAGALGVPLTALVREQHGEPVRGSAVTATLLEVFDEPGVTFELLRMRVPAGRRAALAAACARGDRARHGVGGGLRAGPADAPLVAGPGEHIAWAADVPHVYGTVGPDEVVATLLIRTPPRDPLRGLTPRWCPRCPRPPRRCAR